MLATQTALSTDQLYAIGFGDGLAGRPHDRQYCESLDYIMGHTQGQRANPDSLFNLPPAQESYFEWGHGDELLNVDFFQ